MDWDPRGMESEPASVVYRCTQDFFVNVTHGDNVKVSVYHSDKVLTTANIANNLLSYSACVTLGQTESGESVRTRFHCSCTAACHVLLRFSLFDVNEAARSSVCTVRMYY